MAYFDSLPDPIFQETLASSFEEMNLLEDAQIQFDELEASYFQVVKGDPPGREITVSLNWTLPLRQNEINPHFKSLVAIPLKTIPYLYYLSAKSHTDNLLYQIQYPFLTFESTS